VPPGTLSSSFCLLTGEVAGSFRGGTRRLRTAHASRWIHDPHDEKSSFSLITEVKENNSTRRPLCSGTFHLDFRPVSTLVLLLCFL